MSNYATINEQVINKWKEKFNFYWMIPLSHEDYKSVKSGANLLTVTPNKKVPYEWYSKCKGKKVLGIAAGGGQQMAVLSALGAKCTLFDISEEQIKADLEVSNREGYHLEIVKGDMSEKLPFDNESFDIVINPVSNHYIRDIQPFFNEIYRVLKKDGIFIAGLENEIYWAVTPNTNRLEIKLPVDPLADENLYNELIQKGYALQFSHTTAEQIGCQLKAGFILKDMYDDTEEGVFGDLNIPTFIATYSVKQQMQTRIQCEGCPYKSNGSKRVDGINLDKSILLVMHSPGKNEDISGVPLSGTKKTSATKIIESFLPDGKRIDDYAVEELVRCKPTKGDIDGCALAICYRYLEEDIVSHSFKRIVTFCKSAHSIVENIVQRHSLSIEVINCKYPKNTLDEKEKERIKEALKF